MVGLIILAVLVLLILIIFFVPYGVDAEYADEIFRLKIKAGPLRIKILPKKPKSEKQLAKARRKKEKKEAKKAAKKAAKAKKQEEAKNKPKNETEKVKAKPTLDFFLALAKMGIHAIRRFFRSFSIDYLALNYVVATGDPYDTAMQYGYACAAVEAIPKLAGDTIRVKKKNICIGSDFTAEKPVIGGRIVLSLRLFKLVHLAFAFAVEFIQWKLKHTPTPSEDTGNGKE